MPASELIGARMADYLDEEPAVIHARLNPTVERQDHRLVRCDGSEIWVSVISTPLSDAEGRRTGTISTLSEISERKRLEVDLRLRAAAHEAVAELAERALAGDDLDSLMERAALSAADILGAEFATIAEVAPGRATRRGPACGVRLASVDVGPAHRDPRRTRRPTCAWMTTSPS